VVKPGPLIVAVVVALALARRWRRVSNENRVLALLAIAGLAVYGSGLVHPPNLEHTIERVGHALGPYTYLLVGVMAFLETGAFVGLIAPGEFTVLFGGVVAGQGRIEIVPLIALVWACAVAGDAVTYVLGRRLGRGFMVRHGPRVKITEPRLEQVERFFERHGGKTILLGRFVGLVRALAPFIAGASKMAPRRFFPADIVAAGLWSATFCLLGFVFWRSFSQVIALAKRSALALGLVISLVVGSIAAYRWLSVPANRARAQAYIDDQPVLRRIARVVVPPVHRAAGPARFAWNRLTPGQLGLEFTTLLAVLLVGAFSFGGLAAAVAGHPGSLTGDMTAFDAARSVRAGWVLDAVSSLTDLGALTVTGAAVLATVAYLGTQRQWLQSVPLGAAMVLTVIAVNVTKAATDRPRPRHPLAETAGSSFPSGHSAYAVAYVAIAVAIAHASPKLLRRALLVGTGIALAVFVGLSRIYLRAHYLSDVLGGWALAAAIFALCGMIALLVGFLRQNARAR